MVDQDIESKADELAEPVSAAPDWKAFAIAILRQSRDGLVIGDVDGGVIQDEAVRYGLLVAQEVDKACGERCACAEMTDFPTTCYFYAHAVKTSLN